MCAKSSQVAEVGYKPAHIHNRHTAHQQVEPVKQWSSVWVTLACQTCASLTVQTCSWVNPFTGESVYETEARSCSVTSVFYMWVMMCVHITGPGFGNSSKGAESPRGGKRGGNLRAYQAAPHCPRQATQPSPSLSASISVFLSMFFPCHTFQLTWWSSELPQTYILPPILLVNLWAEGGKEKQHKTAGTWGSVHRDSESNSNTFSSISRLDCALFNQSRPLPPAEFIILCASACSVSRWWNTPLMCMRPIKTFSPRQMCKIVSELTHKPQRIVL